MDPRSNRSPAPESAAVTVTAASLSEAYRRIRTEFGADAVILNTRSVTRPSGSGLGIERAVELTVTRGQTVSAPDRRRTTGIDQLVDRLEGEIARLEDKVAFLMEGHRPTTSTQDADDLEHHANPNHVRRPEHGRHVACRTTGS